MNDQTQVIQTFEKIGIIPVVVLEHAKDAIPLGKALADGGLPAAEITFRTAAAEESIRLLKKELPELLLGAGTILNTDQAKAAVDAGAGFIVSPGLNPEVVTWCRTHEIAVIPGVQTATEFTEAVNLGLTEVKFFPAEAAGGLPMLKSLAAAFPDLRFMATGGINEKNIKEYLSYDKMFACGGSYMVKKELIHDGRFDEIERLTKEAAELVKELKIHR